MTFIHVIAVYIFHVGINNRLNFTHGTCFVIYSQIIANYILNRSRNINDQIVF